VSYLTSKKANIASRVKAKKANRAIKDIEFARNLAMPVHTQQKNSNRKIEHNLV
jgi:hypothetical protein